MNGSKLTTAARLLLGTVFFVFGLNGFLHFIPQPPPSGDALAFVGGLAASGYFFPLLKATEVLAGLALLANRFVPLALVVLAPIVVNIVAFHAFLAPGGMVLPLFIVGLGAYLAYSQRSVFSPLLRAKPEAQAVPRARVGASAASAA